MYASGSYDPVSSRIGREGLDRSTVDHYVYLVSHPEIAHWFGSTGRSDVTEDQIIEFLVFLSAGPDALERYSVPDLPSYLQWITANKREGGELAAAFAGLLALAALEGLARRGRPSVSYPYMSVRSIEQVAFPVAELLVAADLLAGAAMLCTMLRSYILVDPFQRQSERGQQLVARCRQIEHLYALERRVACQEAAWQLREHAEHDILGRVALATVFYAIGDPVRAYAIGRREHLPSVETFTDMVEVSVDLAPWDPLLQAVWRNYLLGDRRIDLPERIALPLRMRRREVNSAYKGIAEGVRRASGVDLSDAYAKMLFGFVSGLWRDHGYEAEAWAAIVSAIGHPGILWNSYPGGFVRILDLYNLALDAGTRLPGASHIFAFSGWRNPVETDIRAVASASLLLDSHTGWRGQHGRSLAYDSPFIIESWRRKEDTATSVDALEVHRAAGIEYWLLAVPPFTPPAKRQKERRILERDSELTEEYQALIAALNISNGDIHHQIYGDESRRRVLHIDEGERAMRLNRWVDAREEWWELARRDFPSYAALRTQKSWTVANVQSFVRTGLPL
jgi:hypothetical protein